MEVAVEINNSVENEENISVWDIHQWVDLCYTGCHDSIELLESWLYSSLQDTSSV